MKWTLFKDELPDKRKWVFVTNFEEVWITIHDQELNPSKMWMEIDIAWAYIDMPKVPLKPKSMHLCRQGYLSCLEDEDGGLVLKTSQNKDAYWNVDFCPFCGKKAWQES